MKPDDFENRLQRQRPREIPATWRADILRNAQAAAPRSPARTSWLSTVRHQLSSLFWPHPKAWAGLAAAWIVIGLLHFAARENSRIAAKAVESPSTETLMARREQQRLWAELGGTTTERVFDRPRNQTPRPRSELPQAIQTV